MDRQAGVANHAACSASKFAVAGLTQRSAAELGEHGIRVNAGCPGIIADMQMRVEAEALNQAQGGPAVGTRAQALPLRRAGTPDDIAGVVAFLASAEAAYMTGQAINVTGACGWSTVRAGVERPHDPAGLSEATRSRTEWRNPAARHRRTRPSAERPSVEGTRAPIDR